MGLLDDAIREHLELKRRLGADQGEVERLEREAFGAQDAAGASPDGAAEPAEPAKVAAPPVPEPEAEVAPPPPPAPEPDAVEPAVDQPTRQFTLEELEDAAEPEPAPEAAPADTGEHDELEETPDFLQETPDHDRLWFEQKPPKDFDF